MAIGHSRSGLARTNAMAVPTFPTANQPVVFERFKVNQPADARYLLRSFPIL
ncbi:hypothetical protein GLE_4349 [Lysobacter enzymogenes]|uniref:Uncharacterized protein n=1 Tax=Lysobacter enzymogenes TaxID=69 RepID=A0A0S2DM80_LYSEN|nr:hypothetical protein GLE_4349 [Lysobacter enzymogenes]